MYIYIYIRYRYSAGLFLPVCCEQPTREVFKFKNHPLQVPIQWIDIPLKLGRGENSIEVRQNVPCSVMGHSVSFLMFLEIPPILVTSIQFMNLLVNFVWVAFHQTNWGSSALCPWRSHPMALPHLLIPDLVAKNLWPNHKPRELRRYWNHIRSSGDSLLGNISPSFDHVPLWIWGDGAQCNNQFNVVVLAMGCCLDQRSFSLDFCYPLTFVKEDPCLNWNFGFRGARIFKAFWFLSIKALASNQIFNLVGVATCSFIS